MDGHSHQPPLLSLQDMLNLSDNEDNYDITANPFDISHFFEPIDPTKKSPIKSKIKAEAEGYSSGQNTNAYFYSTGQSTPNFIATQPFCEPASNQVATNDDDILNPNSICDFEQLNPELQINSEHRSDVIGCSGESPFPPDPLEADLETFDINFVTSEIKASGAEDSEAECLDFLPNSETTVNDQNFNRTDSTEQRVLSDIPPDDTPTPRLTHVTLESVSKKETLKTALPISRFQNECRLEAIEQLQRIIDTLKRYSRTLEDFLAHEGDHVIVEYEARNTLSDILPEISESGEDQHPLYLPHILTKLLVDRVKGRTILSKLPKRQPIRWKTSDLLLLQEYVLESVISKKMFFLRCRFSEILTDMGFDSDDLHKLSQCGSQQSELVVLKNILQEHSFCSKLKSHSRQKAPILKMSFTTNKLSGTPRVVSYPTPESLVIDKWNQIKEIRRNTFLSSISKDAVDWLFVTKKLLMSKSSLDIDEATCQSAFDHIISQRINNRPWSKDELMKLREIRYESQHLSWDVVAARLSTNRTPFSCFVKYKLYCLDSQHYQSFIPYRSLRNMEECIKRYKGNLGAATLELSCQRGYNLKPASLLALYRSRFDRRHKKGSYTIAEDALLLVAMEKYATDIKDGDGEIQIFESVAYTLPWRRTSHWRTRLNIVLTGVFHTNWTLAMDTKLLELVEEYGPKYKMIQRYFAYKSRKQCRSRYTKIQSDLQRMTLEEFHLIYNGGRKNFSLSRLNAVADYLQMAIRAKLNGSSSYVGRADLEFLKLRRVPMDSSLELYLNTFPVKLMVLALDRLSQTLMYILDKIEQSQSIEDKPKTSFKSGCVNRRTFVLDCPASVASALHLRNIQLFPIDKCSMNDFESQVYFYWKRFSLKCVSKLSTKRKSIPSAEILRRLPSIQRILVPIAPQLGAPVMILPTSTNPDETRSVEQDILHELERKKKGGALKGSKRKSTIIKEMKARAAKTRWLKRAQESAVASNTSCDWEDAQSSLDFPVDTKPRSITTNDLSKQVQVDCKIEQANTSCASYEYGIQAKNSIRDATIGLLSDHAYYSSMCSPADFSSLTLSQLFSLMNNQK